MFNSCVGNSVGGEVCKLQTSTRIVRGCWEHWAVEIMMVFNWRRLASEIGLRIWEEPFFEEPANWSDWLGKRAMFCFPSNSNDSYAAWKHAGGASLH